MLTPVVPTPVSSPRSVLLVDLEGRLVYGDPQLCGGTFAACIGSSVTDARLVDDGGAAEVEAALQTAVRESCSVDFELPVRLGDGRVRRLAARAIPLLDAARVNTIAIELCDSELVETQHSQLLTLDRLAAMGLLASGVVHDLSNPIAGLRSTLEVATEAGNLDVARLPLMFEALDRCERSLMALRVFATQLSSRHGPVDIDQLVHVCAWLVTRSIPDVDVVVDGDELPLVTLERSLLVQLLVDLISTSAHASASAGEPIVRVATREDDHGLTIKISDDGGPVAAVDIDCLFDASDAQPRARHGTGLGLPMCRHLASRLGLSLTAQRTETGLELELWLPLALIA
ncbi:MAG: PAS domain-containing protein [Myxococcales bacterium]|nr:PAS domain-containing protein [Myxococcales bacterium]